MQTYFVQITTVQLAAKLLDNEAVMRYPHYACIGMLPQNADMELKNICQTEGIDDLLEKAESFHFGQVCVKVIDRYLKGYDHKQLLQCEAAVAALFLGNELKFDENVKEKIKLILKAFVRRSQIQTHTTKPGYEDIDTWLESFYKLRTEYEDFLDNFSQMIIDANKDQNINNFCSKEDAIIKMALSTQAVDIETLQEINEEKAVSVFGTILTDVCKAEMVKMLAINQNKKSS